MAAPERVVVACVAENTPRFHHEVVYLFKSLRYFGGRLADAPGIVYFVGSVNAEVAATLAALDVTVQIVDRLDERCPHANKIQMLDDTKDHDYLVAVDTDIVVVRDFSFQLIGNSIAAKPADSDPLTLVQWQKIFGYFNLQLPQTRCLTSFTLSETIPYFNSGVIVIPRMWVSRLRTLWREYIVRLLDAYGDLVEIEEHRFFTDQIALSLAIARGEMPIRELPLEMNFPIHHPVHDDLEPTRIAPWLLHHHHRWSDSNRLADCCYENINREIRRIHAALSTNGAPESVSDSSAASALSSLGNGSISENRHETDPGFESTICSCGANLDYKIASHNRKGPSGG